MQIECIWDQPSLLGEGPLWHPGEKKLFWVDIMKPSLQSLDVRSGDYQRWAMPTEIGCIGLHHAGGLVAALAKGFFHIALPSGQLTALSETIAEHEPVIFNDGKCDRFGRFWAGTKDLEESRSIATLYCLNHEGRVTPIVRDLCITNGIAWNRDNSIMYLTDSPARTIYQYDFEGVSGTIANRRVFAKIPEDRGYPDGLTIDQEDYIWSCHWEGGCITRYAPNGRIDDIIPLPIRRPTSCCFGGDQLKTLYVTSASCRLPDEILKKEPLNGAVFAMDVGVAGWFEPMYGKSIT